jgi:multisubunit Na+/H+ antiporter MnhB subunit
VAVADVDTNSSSTDTADQPERLFSQSILISGVRCLLTYLLFPFIFPIIGVTSGIGSSIGLVVGTIAIVANVFSIRRFHKADHKYKWPVSALNAGVIVLLVVLIALDANNLFS